MFGIDETESHNFSLNGADDDAISSLFTPDANLVVFSCRAVNAFFCLSFFFFFSPLSLLLPNMTRAFGSPKIGESRSPAS